MWGLNISGLTGTGTRLAGGPPFDISVRMPDGTVKSTTAVPNLTAAQLKEELGGVEEISVGGKPLEMDATFKSQGVVPASVLTAHQPAPKVGAMVEDASSAHQPSSAPVHDRELRKVNIWAFGNAADSSGAVSTDAIKTLAKTVNSMFIDAQSYRAKCDVELDARSEKELAGIIVELRQLIPDDAAVGRADAVNRLLSRLHGFVLGNQAFFAPKVLGPGELKADLVKIGWEDDWVQVRFRGHGSSRLPGISAEPAAGPEGKAPGNRLAAYCRGADTRKILFKIDPCETVLAAMAFDKALGKRAGDYLGVIAYRLTSNSQRGHGGRETRVSTAVELIDGSKSLTAVPGTDLPSYSGRTAKSKTGYPEREHYADTHHGAQLVQPRSTARALVDGQIVPNKVLIVGGVLLPVDDAETLKHMHRALSQLQQQDGTVIRVAARAPLVPPTPVARLPSDGSDSLAEAGGTCTSECQAARAVTADQVPPPTSSHYVP